MSRRAKNSENGYFDMQRKLQALLENENDYQHLRQSVKKIVSEVSTSSTKIDELAIWILHGAAERFLLETFANDMENYYNNPRRKKDYTLTELQFAKHPRQIPKAIASLTKMPLFRGELIELERITDFEKVDQWEFLTWTAFWKETKDFPLVLQQLIYDYCPEQNEFRPLEWTPEDEEELDSDYVPEEEESDTDEEENQDKKPRRCQAWVKQYGKKRKCKRKRGGVPYCVQHRKNS